MALKFRKSYVLSVDFSGAGFVGPMQPGVDRPAASVDIRPPFTIDFSVERANLAEASSAEFSVLGLGASVRRKLYKDNYNTASIRAVEFWAGYLPPPSNVKLSRAQSQDPRQVSFEAAQNFSVLFRGNVYQGYSELAGPPWRTTLRCQSGNYAFQHGHTSRSYKAGTPKRQIILDLINDLPNLRPGAVGAFGGSISRGVTYSGATVEYLKELTDGKFFVDNERVFCLQDNEYVPGNVPVISESSGLMGAPRREQTLVSARMLFEPGLVIGQRVELKSRNSPELSGFYRIGGLRHSGSISESVASPVFTYAELSSSSILTTEVAAP